MKNLLLILVLFTTVLLADENRNFFPMGEKELFSGNTGTGGIASAAASMYNPGALTQIKDNKFSVSATAFYNYIYKGEPQVNIEGSDQNYESASFTSVPSSIISVYNFDGWTGAFSIITPFNEELENQQVWNIPGKTVYYQEKMEDSIMWMGLSGAKKLADGWSVGLTLFANKSYSLSISSLYNTDGNNTYAELQASRIQTNIWSASAVLGVLKEMESFSIGFRAHSPTMKFMGDANYYTSFVSYNSGAFMDSIVNRNGVDTKDIIPADFTLGVNYHLTPTFNILADVSYQLGRKFDKFDDPVVVAAYGDDNNVEYKAMYRANIGIDYYPTERLEILAGAYYVPTAAPKNGERFDGIGISTGGYYATKQTKSGFGLFGLKMTGDAPVDGSTRKGKRTFISYGLVLSTSYNF